MQPCELKFVPIWGFGTELFANFEALKVQISKDLRFGSESRVLRTEKYRNGDLANSKEGVIRVFRAAHTLDPIFQGMFPPTCNVSKLKQKFIKEICWN